jgi:nucleotide-binding universal stress UspA family protein
MSSIVVGVDGSPQSTAALAWAVDEARSRGAELTVVNVHRGRETGPDPQLGATHFPSRATVERAADEAERQREEDDEAVHRRAEGVVSSSLRDVDTDGVRVRTLVLSGRPAAQLIEASQDADLLVVGSRGRGGFGGLRLGSVSEQCTRHASCPVVVVR